MNTIHILGIANPELTPEQKQLLDSCPNVFGAARFSALVPAPAALHPIAPLRQAVALMAELLQKGNIAVFASGDPLFYGITRTLLRHFKSEQLHISPALSSMQRAAALFCLPWEDARLLSLHGRQANHIPSLFLRHNKSFTLTDATNSPGNIAREILHYLREINEPEEAKQWKVSVAEHIGDEKEKVFTGSLAECARQEFGSLNVLSLFRLKPIPPPPYSFGLQENNIQHSRGLITKNEVRAASLHALKLPKTGVFWDVGAGSGSISIEAARMNPDLLVYAVEHKKEEIENIKANIRRLRCYNVVPVFGRAPEAFAALPPPDRIFVGGSSGSLEKIVKQAKNVLPEGGYIVINGVIEKTIEAAPQLLAAYGFHWASSQISVVRKNKDDETRKFNPITMTVGVKQEGSKLPPSHDTQTMRAT